MNHRFYFNTVCIHSIHCLFIFIIMYGRYLCKTSKVRDKLKKKKLNVSINHHHKQSEGNIPHTLPSNALQNLTGLLKCIFISPLRLLPLVLPPQAPLGQQFKETV